MASRTVEIPTPQHQSMVEITREVAVIVAASGVSDGVVHIFTEHTTCGVMINENADPDVVGDLLRRFEKLVPWHDPADRHAEGNSAAHLRSIMVGSSVTVPVAAGGMHLGTWQGIYLTEFDGPRRRRVTVTLLGER